MSRPVTVCRSLLLGALFALLPVAGWSGEVPPDSTVKSTDAGRFVGETVTVCGPVAGTAYFPHLNGGPTYINFDQRYPEQSFTVVIWARYLDKFEAAPDLVYANKDLCVTGKITTYKGKPQIVVLSPDQIRIQDAGLAAEQFSYEERVLIKAMLASLGYEVDEGTGEWNPASDLALSKFQVERGLEEEGGRSPKTLRALAQAVDQIPAGDQQKILRLLLLNLAQRGEAADRK